MSLTDTRTTPAITLLMFPTGMTVTTFSAMTDLLSTALGEDADVVLRAPSSAHENSAVVVNNLSNQEISQRLRAAAGLIDGAPRPDEPDTDGLPTLALGPPLAFTDGGVDFSLAFDDATREDGQALLGAIAKALTQSFEDNPEAINYLQWGWQDATDPRITYRLIGVKPGQPTPHDLRVAADAECARLRALLIAHEINPDTPLEPAR